MAISAFLSGMRTLQFELGFVVVKFVLPPSGRIVALRTRLIGVPFFRDLTGMHIFMTIHTALAQPLEFPFVFLFMAGKARGGHMRSCQREFRSAVVFQGVEAFRKPVYRVAKPAIGTHAILDKFPFMEILVAGGAIGMWQRIGHAFRNMAFPAVYCFMFAF